ncbi:MAG: response regulator transcription factor [Crocinitomicaceae bacterium]|jgi:DNA-binding response OmpR family regulator|nr:response regulator transcription factor [Crocinitomicaceae bacterium]
MKQHFLLAEDDENLGTLLTTFLNSKGFQTKWVKNGEEAISYYRSFTNTIDFIILDVMMPEKDGFSVAKEIRLTDKKTPILFLTAKSMKDDKLKGFEVGADDYLTKPFAMEELIARIQAIIRRVGDASSAKTEKLSIGALAFDPHKSILYSSTGEKKLTTKENALLTLLARNVNEVLDRQATLRAVWGDDNYFNGRSMDVYIAKLRKLLSEDPAIEIMNIHGIGFKLIIK